MASHRKTTDALDPMLEELQPPRRGQVVVAERRGVSVLEEFEVRGQARLLDRAGRVRELRHEVGDEDELGREGVPRAVPVHLYNDYGGGDSDIGAAPARSP